jgi:hypothetical protein
MAVQLVRPYPVSRLADARAAVKAAARGDFGPLQHLYRDAAEALAAMDPDEVEDFRADHPRIHKHDDALANAAIALADTWEGTVSVGSTVDGARFRGFALLSAQVRYELEPARRDASQLRAYSRGAPLKDTSPLDAALYATLPALTGLGPELPEELDEPCPIAGEPVVRLLGLPETEDWSGIDPLDAIALTPEACRAHYAAASPAWRTILGRGLGDGRLGGGLLVRRGPA